MGSGFWVGFWVAACLSIICVAINKDCISERNHEEAMSKMGYCKKWDVDRFNNHALLGWEPCMATAVPVRVERP